MNNIIGPEATERMLEQLVVCQRLALVGRLSIFVTHEVNNHLTGVSGYAQLLLGQEKAKEIQKELDKISVSANQCHKLISGLRRVGRFPGSDREYDNINLIIKSALDLCQSQFKKKSLEIVEEFSSDVPSLEVDTPALEQAFLNLIQNSFDALQVGGSRLTVKTFKESGRVVAIFEDDGPGLSEEARTNLFVPFFTTKDDPQSLGLGLAAAKMVIVGHQGSIEIKNPSGGGTLVEVGLPCNANE